jgi:crotonobetainyl-CoA:carnitine CoA-transferase CaiB-like acyl-CoA transferase
MGAKVIKVEQPGLGDYMRATPPTRGGRSPVHGTANRNKLSIGIDLKTPEGKGVLRRLVRTADVFVEGFRPGVIKRLGFSFKEVRRLSPRVVYCSISTFGQASKLSSMPAHDINFQALAGTLDYPRHAVVPMMQLGDMISGMFAALSILGAMVHQKGATFIDVPIVPSLTSWMIIPVSSYLATGKSPTEGQSLLFGSTPYYNLFRTKDGRYMAVAAIEREFWGKLVTALGVPELEQKRFGTAKERREVTATLKRVFATKTRDQWARLLMDKNTCATPVLSVGEALNSEWAKVSSMLLRVKGDGRVLNGPVRGSPLPRTQPFTRAPSLGEDTEGIMMSLGYSRSDVKRLKDKHVLQ